MSFSRRDSRFVGSDELRNWLTIGTADGFVYLETLDLPVRNSILLDHTLSFGCLILNNSLSIRKLIIQNNFSDDEIWYLFIDNILNRGIFNLDFEGPVAAWPPKKYKIRKVRKILQKSSIFYRVVRITTRVSNFQDFKTLKNWLEALPLRRGPAS